MFFIIYGLFQKREYIFHIYKTDIILVFVASFLILPSIILNAEINSRYLFQHFYPVRIIITYKILTFIYYENSL